MDNIMKADELSVSSREIRIFAEDVYDYIWQQTNFQNPDTEEAFEQDYASRNPIDIGWEQYDGFLFRVGRAVRISQFLLRDYFRNILNFSMPNKNIYKKEVKLMWSHWLEKRSNIFVKVIDTLAIIAEAFLFCDCQLSQMLEVKEMKEWFIEWFEEMLAPAFIESGGWKVFNQVVIERYKCLQSIERIINSIKHYNHFNDVENIYDCHLVTFLRKSRVKFPIPENALCIKCRHPKDEKYLQRTVYVRLRKEYEDVNVAYKKEHELQKEFHDNKELNENIPDFVQVQENVDYFSKSEDFQNNDNYQSLSTQVSNDYANYVSQTSFSNEDNDNGDKQGLENFNEIINSDNDLSDVEPAKCITDSKFSIKTKEFFSAGEFPFEDQGFLSEGSELVSTTEAENKEDSSLKTDSSVGNIHLEEQVNLSNESTKLCDKESISTCNILSSSESMDLLPICLHGTFLTDQASHNYSNQDKSLTDTNDVSVTAVTFPEYSVSEYDRPLENSFSEKSSDSIICEEQQPNLDSLMTQLMDSSSGSNSPEIIDTPYFSVLEEVKQIYGRGSIEMFYMKILFSKIFDYERFIHGLYLNVKNPNYQKMSDQQNNFYFVSEEYSNSLEKMFEADFNAIDEEPVDNIINSEKLITTTQDDKSKVTNVVTENGECEQTSNDYYNHLEFITGEYRYYLFEEKTTSYKKKRKPKSNRKG